MTPSFSFNVDDIGKVNLIELKRLEQSLQFELVSCPYSTYRDITGLKLKELVEPRALTEICNGHKHYILNEVSGTSSINWTEYRECPLSAQKNLLCRRLGISKDTTKLQSSYHKFTDEILSSWLTNPTGLFTLKSRNLNLLSYSALETWYQIRREKLRRSYFVITYEFSDLIFENKRGNINASERLEKILGRNSLTLELDELVSSEADEPIIFLHNLGQENNTSLVVEYIQRLFDRRSTIFITTTKGLEYMETTYGNGVISRIKDGRIVDYDDFEAEQGY